MSLQIADGENEILEGLETTEWDVVLLNETLKGVRDKMWKTAHEHLFHGSGGILTVNSDQKTFFDDNASIHVWILLRYNR